jgi:leucyl aminopeptidase
MQTIINKITRLPKKGNIIFLISADRELDENYFDKQEIKFIRNNHKKNKQMFFSFNRYGYWLFVQYTSTEKEKDVKREKLRIAGSKATQELNTLKLNTVILASHKSACVFPYLEGMALSNYQFLKYKKDAADETNSLGNIEVYQKELDDAFFNRLNIITDAVSKCRDLVNEPVNALNAEDLAHYLEKTGKDAGIKVEIFNKKKIESLKMGGLLAVNKGSIDPPTFTIMEWKPDDAINQKPYVLVGKGVVYDTGGLNIKTGNFMNDMKMDMAGGATAATTLYAIAKAKLPLHIIALIPATDNRPSQNAYVSGDVITMFDGTRVEVKNTDAEGRLILADALAYAKKYNPELVIDMATLTGSAVRAIGTGAIAAMQSKAEKSMSKLIESANHTYERIIEFPLWEEYAEDLKSDIADITNLGGANAGQITAGKFLQHFTAYPYIHLDIAGPAFAEKAFKYYGKGGTGFGIRLLFHFFQRISNLPNTGK